MKHHSETLQAPPLLSAGRNERESRPQMMEHTDAVDTIAAGTNSVCI